MGRVPIIVTLFFALLMPQRIFASPSKYIQEKANECKEMLSFFSKNNADFSRIDATILASMAMILRCNKPEITKKLSRNENSTRKKVTSRVEDTIRDLSPKESKKIEILKAMLEREWEEETWVKPTKLETKKLDSKLKAIWYEMARALQQKQIEKALTFFEKKARPIYRKQFTAMLPVLDEIAAEHLASKLVLEDVDNSTATYHLLTTREGTGYTFQLRFVKDATNNWKIYRF